MKKLLMLCIFIFTIFLIYFSISAYRKYFPVPNDAVSLEFPLKNGTYIITASGKLGSTHGSNIEKYALDIVKNIDWRSFFSFRNTSLENNNTYNTTIYSPCNGEVREIVDGIVDQPIGIKDPSVGGGNIIVIACDGFDVYMAHIKSGSFKVKIDDIVNTGEEIASIGNSGNTDGPHLHINAYRIDKDTLERIPLPMIFNGRFLYTLDRVNN